jgi:glycosyltransferase involved in cell wall biosynthesis
MRDGIVKTGYPADRVAIIPNSADIETFAVDPAAVASFRAGLPWLGSRQLVVYAGTLGRINGVAYLAEVAARVREINPEVRFLVVGGGAEESLVRSVAARLGVLDSTFFMLPKLPKTEMPALFGAADVGCSLFVDLPEMWSNSANKFFDSLAAGKPVAINYGGWQAEILRTTSAGIVLPPRDYRLAARMLADFLNNPTRLHDASAASGRLAVEQFARDRLAVDLDETLTSARDDYDKRAAAR